MVGPSSRELVDDAARAIASATALVITAGAGMGVDSGLPDFRGQDGFWAAYPPYRELGLRFEELANPRWFDTDPALAWGFYGHRLELYRRTRPHAGFAILLAWARRMRAGHFVFTSNVDGQFQRAGFAEERVYECHGAIDWLQCTASCGVGIFQAAPVQVEIDARSFRAAPPFPACPSCGALARPNVLMFGDWGWDSRRADAQGERFGAWLDALPRTEHLVVVESGAGSAIPTVRRLGEGLAAHAAARLVRLNVREPEVPPGQIGLALGARDALEQIDQALAATAGG